jgi:hypothetical protein
MSNNIRKYNTDTGQLLLPAFACDGEIIGSIHEKNKKTC